MNESVVDESNPSSRPASPDEDRGAVGGGLFAKSPMHDEVSIAPKELPDRRKSMSWKNFNLKRQLSKVNMKIGLNMSNENESAPKSNSVFYTQTECSGENSDDSPPKDPIALGVECRESMTESSMAETVDVSIESTTAGETESVGDTPPPLPSRRVDFAGDAVAGQQSTRPNNLPISSAGGDPNVPPTRPPRQKLKEKRDQRLLSVPNIKYQVREPRSRPNRNDSSPSVGGGGGGGGNAATKKTRKYSKFVHSLSNTKNYNNNNFYLYMCLYMSCFSKHDNTNNQLTDNDNHIIHVLVLQNVSLTKFLTIN